MVQQLTPVYYGFDLGGSKIELAVYDADLQLRWQQRLPTPQDSYSKLLTTFEELVHNADHFCQQQLGEVQRHIGIGVPGIPNYQEKSVFTTNIPVAKSQALIKDLEQLLAAPISFNNDANCFALSEAWAEEFRHHAVVVGVILGTGLGGGLIVNQRIISGKNGIAAEIGHLRLTVDALDILGMDCERVLCGCGQYGCFEGYLSGTGFERLYQWRTGQKRKAAEIIECYHQQEPAAIAHVEQFLSLLAVYLGNLCTLFDPDLIVFGGGLSNFDLIYQQLPQRLLPHLFQQAEIPQLAQARYGDAGGTRGAALLNYSPET